MLCKYTQYDKALTGAKDSIRPWFPSLAPSKESMNFLQDFMEAHSRAFQKAIHCEILLRGGIDKFDFKRHYYMKFNLQLRSDSGGNPGIAFTVENAEIRPLSEIGFVAAQKAALDAGRATRDANEAHLRATQVDFVGLFMTLYHFRGYSLWQPHRLHHTPTFDAYLKQLHPEMWLRELQLTVKMGIVFRKTSPDDPVQKYGRIKKVGSEWNWVQLTSEELVQFGMPGDCPGLLF